MKEPHNQGTITINDEKVKQDSKSTSNKRKRRHFVVPTEQNRKYSGHKRRRKHKQGTRKICMRDGARTKVLQLSNLIEEGSGFSALDLTKEEDKGNLRKYSGGDKWVLALQDALKEYERNEPLSENTKQGIQGLANERERTTKGWQKRQQGMSKICTRDGARTKVLQLSNLIAKGSGFGALDLTEEEDKGNLRKYSGWDEFVLALQDALKEYERNEPLSEGTKQVIQGLAKAERGRKKRETQKRKTRQRMRDKDGQVSLDTRGVPLHSNQASFGSQVNSSPMDSQHLNRPRLISPENHFEQSSSHEQKNKSVAKKKRLGSAVISTQNRPSLSKKRRKSIILNAKTGGKASTGKKANGENNVSRGLDHSRTAQRKRVLSPLRVNVPTRDSGLNGHLLTGAHTDKLTHIDNLPSVDSSAPYMNGDVQKHNSYPHQFLDQSVYTATDNATQGGLSCDNVTHLPRYALSSPEEIETIVDNLPAAAYMSYQPAELSTSSSTGPESRGNYQVPNYYLSPRPLPINSMVYYGHNHPCEQPARQATRETEEPQMRNLNSPYSFGNQKGTLFSPTLSQTAVKKGPLMEQDIDVCDLYLKL